MAALLCFWPLPRPGSRGRSACLGGGTAGRAADRDDALAARRARSWRSAYRRSAPSGDEGRRATIARTASGGPRSHGRTPGPTPPTSRSRSAISGLAPTEDDDAGADRGLRTTSRTGCPTTSAPLARPRATNPVRDLDDETRDSARRDRPVLAGEHRLPLPCSRLARRQRRGDRVGSLRGRCRRSPTGCARCSTGPTRSRSSTASATDGCRTGGGCCAYIATGDLEAVLDEYLHQLFSDRGSGRGHRRAAARDRHEVAEAVSLRSPTLRALDAGQPRRRPRVRRPVRAPLRRPHAGRRGRPSARGAPRVQQPVLAVRAGVDLGRPGGHRLPLVVPRRLPLEHALEPRRLRAARGAGRPLPRPRGAQERRRDARGRGAVPDRRAPLGPAVRAGDGPPGRARRLLTRLGLPGPDTGSSATSRRSPSAPTWSATTG